MRERLTGQMKALGLESEALHEEWARYQGPVLVFDQARLRHNMVEFADAGGANGTALLAVKSFPAAEVLDIAHAAGLGFEVSNAAEYSLLPQTLAGRHVTVNSPIPQNPADFVAKGNALIVNVDEVPTEPADPALWRHGLRVTAGSIPGVGDAVGDVSFERQGLPWTDLSQHLDSFRNGTLAGVHLHNPSEENDASFYERAVSEIVGLFAAHEIPLDFVNVGGGFHAIDQARLGTLLATLSRLAAPATLISEPGQILARHAGFLMCRIERVRQVSDWLIHLTVDASFDSHAKWSAPSWMGTPTAPATRLDHRRLPSAPTQGVVVVVGGASCYNSDRFGIFATDEGAALEAGQPLILSNLNGYSWAWNRPFNGVPAARTLFI